MSKIKSVLNVIMTFSLCYYAGHAVFVIWEHKISPELYAIQSAPWYTSILVNGIIILVIVVICALIKLILNYIEKDRNDAKKP